MDVKKIGSFIKTLRKEKGLTQEDLAEALFVSGKTVSRWETGSTLPDLITLQQISEFFGVDIRELIDGEHFPEKKEGDVSPDGEAARELPSEDPEKEMVRKMAEYSDNKEKRKSRKTGLIFLLVLLILLAAAALFFIKKCNDDMDRVQNGTVNGEVTHYEAKEDGGLELYLLSEETSIVRILVTQNTQMTDILKRRIEAKQKGLILQARTLFTEREIRASEKKGEAHSYQTEALYLVGETTIPYDSDGSMRKTLLELREGYTLAQAERDGCVVLDSMDLLHGEMRLSEFLSRTKEGSPAMIRVYQHYQSPSVMEYCLKDLEYTGAEYILTFYDQTGDTHEWFLSQNSYKYLKEETIIRYERTTKAYVLTDDLNATYEGWLAGMLSSYYDPTSSDDAYKNFAVLLDYDISEPVNQGRPVYEIEFGNLSEDGPRMRFVLGHGSTSGIFTYTLEVYGEKEGLLYSRVFRSEMMELSFVSEAEQIPNGDGSYSFRTKLRVKGVVPSTGAAHLYNIVIRDGQLELEELPSEPKEGVLYGNITVEDEALVKEIARNHFKAVADSFYQKEWRSFTDDQVVVELAAPVPWGTPFDDGNGSWTFYAEKYDLRDHPDRVACVLIRPGNDPLFSVFLVKPLDTNTWEIVNYGF